MNTKNEIRTELNDFLVGVAGEYGELIAKDIPPVKFKSVVANVGELRDKAQNNLVDIARRAVVAAIHPLEEEAEIPAPVNMAALLVPEDITHFTRTRRIAPHQRLLPLS